MKKRLSRAKRKLQKQKLLRQKQRLDAQPTMTQDQIDELFKKFYRDRQEREAQENIEAQRKAFEHFLETGEVVNPENFKKFTRFFTKERIGTATQLPDIDLDIDDVTIINHHLESRDSNDE